MVPILPLVLKGAVVVVAVVVPTVGVMGARYMNRSWNLKVNRAQEDQLTAFADESVLNSAQIFKDIDDAEKRHQQKLASALDNLMANAANAGIKLDHQMARAKIETAVMRFKRGGEATPK